MSSVRVSGWQELTVGGVNVQRSLHPQYHDWDALEQGTEPPTAPRASQHKWLPTAPGVCSLLCVCVHFEWVKRRAQIQSMGNHTWSCHVTKPFASSYAPYLFLNIL